MNSEPTEEKIVVNSLIEWNMMQLKEMQSPLNVFLTGEEVGHNPKPEECQIHYEKHGGSDHFRETHIMGWLKK
jgi:hypothetical protein